MKLEKINDFFYRGNLTLFGKKIKLDVEIENDRGASDAQKQSINLVESFSSKHLEAINQWAIKYCKDTEQQLDFQQEKIKIDYSNINAHFEIELAFIPKLGDSQTPIFMLQGECDWDEGYGIFIAYYNDDIFYCGRICAPSMSVSNWNNMLQSNNQIDLLKDLFHYP